MEWVYTTLVSAKKISPIEKLEPDVKKQMWGFVNEICVGKGVDKKVKIEISKVFYTIEYFIKENQWDLIKENGGILKMTELLQ